jgi:hypothetical protein
MVRAALERASLADRITLCGINVGIEGGNHYACQPGRKVYTFLSQFKVNLDGCTHDDREGIKDTFIDILVERLEREHRHARVEKCGRAYAIQYSGDSNGNRTDAMEATIVPIEDEKLLFSMRYNEDIKRCIEKFLSGKGKTTLETMMKEKLRYEERTGIYVRHAGQLRILSLRLDEHDMPIAPMPADGSWKQAGIRYIADKIYGALKEHYPDIEGKAFDDKIIKPRASSGSTYMIGKSTEPMNGHVKCTSMYEPLISISMRTGLEEREATYTVEISMAYLGNPRGWLAIFKEIIEKDNTLRPRNSA